MRWIKILAIGVAVVLVLSVVSALLHLLYLAAIAVAIGAVVVLALRAQQRLRGRREVKSSERQIETPQPPAARPQLDATAAAPRLHDDVEAELARLKREME
jgi:hypothetical protein